MIFLPHNIINNKIMLTDKQQNVVDLVFKRKNIMISGPGGTGKTFIIKHVVSLKNSLLKGFSSTIGVTAMTGTAAVLIGGTTLHSFLGIGLGSGTVQQLITKIGNKSGIWKTLEILIVDEVSMLSAELFDKLEQVARILRNNQKPFGGIQLMLSGDFLQIPCINGEFCFKSQAWKTCITDVVCLDHILRQTDVVFQEILNRARFGEITKQDVDYIKTHSLPTVIPKNGENLNIEPTKMFCKNINVEKINNDKLKQIPNVDIQEYKRRVIWETTPDNKLLQKVNDVPDTVFLGKGAQVMLCVNLNTSEKLVNGSRGVIIGFQDDLPVVKFLDNTIITVSLYNYTIENKNNKVIATVTQIPLKLAYAITIHKSMGATIDCASINFQDIFEYGQAYVALSRVKSLSNLIVENIHVCYFKAHPAALDFYKQHF